MSSLLSALLALGVVTLASGYNTDLDWISGITAKGKDGCIFVPKPNNMNAPTCVPPNNPVTKADVESVAWKLAPKVYFHPLEWYLLADPKPWLESSPLFNITASNWTLDDISREQGENYFNLYQTRTGPMNVASVLIDPEMQNFSTDYMNQKTGGDPLNIDGSSTAKVYYTIGDPGQFNDTMTNSFVITYHYYYEFNGCSNQMFAMNVDGKYQGAEYFMCSPGVHEGDLERITLSCNGEETPGGITSPVAYAGLFSHASYPWASPLVVYQKIEVQLLANIEGMYIGDRTSDQEAFFIPTAENHLYIKAVDEMTNAERVGDLKWGTYSGSWGGGFPETSDYTLTCLYDNLTRMGGCDEENPAVHFLKWGLERLQGDVSMDLMDTLWTCKVPFDDPNKLVGNFDFRGPSYRDYSYMWRWDVAAPLWADEDKQDHLYTCPFSKDDPSATDTSGNEAYTSPDYNVYNFLGGTAGLLIGCAVIYGLLLWLFVYTEPVPESMVSRDNSSGVFTKEKLRREFLAARSFLWLIASLSVYICGVVLCGIGISDVFEALEEVVSVLLWDNLKKGFMAVVILFGVVQFIFIVFTIFIRSQDFVLWNGNSYKNPVAWQGASKFGYIMQAVFSAIIVLMINTTMLLCCFGFFMWTVRFLFQVACDGVLSQIGRLVSGAATDLCLDLNPIGISVEFCGGQLTQICTKWGDLHVEFLVYGSLIFICPTSCSWPAARSPASPCTSRCLQRTWQIL
eukprot:gene5524-4157_t